MDDSNHQLGETDKLVTFNDRDGNRSIALAMAVQGTRTLDIYSYDFDAPVYDNGEFVDAVSELARANTRSQVRILVRDIDSAVKSGHQLIELYRRLPSRIAIRIPDPEVITSDAAFMVVDGMGYIYRELATRFDGSANFYDPLQCRKLTDTFTEMWDRGQPSMQLKRLHI